MTEEIRKKCPTDEVEIVFPPRSDEFWHAYNLAKEIHSWVSCFGGVIFSKEEEKNAEYRCMVPSYPLEIDGLSSYGFGTSYESACPDCKLQLKRKGPLLVHRKYLRNQPFISLCPGFAVNEWVRQIILENGFTGITIGERVQDPKGREIKPYYAVEFDSILPPMHPNTMLWYDDPSYRCDTCKTVIPYLWSRPCYTKKDFVNAKDFNLSCEHVNNNIEQQIIISRRAYDAFKKAKVRIFSAPFPIFDE